MLKLYSAFFLVSAMVTANCSDFNQFDENEGKPPRWKHFDLWVKRYDNCVEEEIKASYYGKDNKLIYIEALFKKCNDIPLGSFHLDPELKTTNDKS